MSCMLIMVRWTKGKEKHWKRLSTARAGFRASELLLIRYLPSANWHRPFGNNRHGPKSGGGLLCPFPRLSVGGAGSPSNAVSPGPTSVPSGSLIHPTVWPQYTNVTRQADKQTMVRQHRANRFTKVVQKPHVRPNFTKFSVRVLPRPRLGPPLTTKECVMYFRFCGWRHVIMQWAIRLVALAIATRKWPFTKTSRCLCVSSSQSNQLMHS